MNTDFHYLTQEETKRLFAAISFYAQSAHGERETPAWSPFPCPPLPSISLLLRRHYSVKICRDEEEEGYGRGQVCILAR